MLKPCATQSNGWRRRPRTVGELAALGAIEHDLDGNLAAVADDLATAEQRRIQARAEQEFSTNEANRITADLDGDASTYQHRASCSNTSGRRSTTSTSLGNGSTRAGAGRSDGPTPRRPIGEFWFCHRRGCVGELARGRRDRAACPQRQAWVKERDDLSAALAEIEHLPLAEVAPDLDALALAAKEKHEIAVSLRSRLSEATFHLNALDDALANATAVQSEATDQLAAAQRVKQLADVCAGNGPHRRSLESWVLAAHLRDVVALANQHLAPMSSGRYELLVSDAVDDRRSQAGLSLTVLDARSGKPRPVASLSGGETFQASLALALGLADVVSANRGGIQIDALFVDEGFGSLDAEALDHAIDVLDGLRSRGSLVGVITHVEALKRALQVGIEVTRNPDGSGSTLHQLIT
ncbi:MAG: SbcC/MukB-like Walker B domain-containing protein [Acidimicrobiales bacterium]